MMIDPILQEMQKWHKQCLMGWRVDGHWNYISILNFIKMGKQKDKAVMSIFSRIRNSEQELQALRQLINQQLDFSLHGSYNMIAQPHQIKKLNNTMHLFNVKPFIELGEQSQLDDRVIQSILKWYGNGQLQVNQLGWETMIISREDQLLAKLTRQRQNIFEELPQYIISYCRKLWLKQYQLHQFIIGCRQFQKQIREWLSQHKLKQYEQIKQFCFTLEERECQCQQICYQLISRYVKKGRNMEEGLGVEEIQKLLLPKNTGSIQIFLKQKQEQFQQAKRTVQIKSSPFLHKQFKTMHIKQTPPYPFSYRQLNSIQQHITRNKTLPSAHQIKTNIKTYTSQIQHNLQLFFTTLKHIIICTIKIDKTKQQLLSNYKGGFKQLFSQISNHAVIIPSQLLHYFKTIQVNVLLNHVFLLFKRYADPVTGKMSCNQFCYIFKSPKIKIKTTKIFKLTQDFRRDCIQCLIKQIYQQSKIQQLKRNLMKQLDLRQIFDCFDQDSNGQITKTDIEVQHKRIMGQQIQQQHLQYWLWRMGQTSTSNPITYESFMYEMIPKSKIVDKNKE